MRVCVCVCRGRLKHGRHFTFKSYISEWAVTCVVCGVEGALATEENPLVANGAWLQVFLSHSLLNNLEHRVTTLLVLHVVLSLHVLYI